MSSVPVSRGFLLERLSDAGRQSQPEEVHLIDRHPKPFIISDLVARITDGFEAAQSHEC